MIAVIGWGSLIWDPRDLAIDGVWHPDGPMLPVEFARVSQDGRLTLVLVDGVPAQQTLWAVSKKAVLEEAAENLRVREGAGRSGIACWPRLQGWGRPGHDDEVVGRWAQSKELEGVVGTALGPKGPNGEKGVAPEAIRLDYLRALEREGRAEVAREYIEKAPPQIQTPFRELVRRELGWGRGEQS